MDLHSKQHLTIKQVQSAALPRNSFLPEKSPKSFTAKLRPSNFQNTNDYNFPTSSPKNSKNNYMPNKLSKLGKFSRQTTEENDEVHLDLNSYRSNISHIPHYMILYPNDSYIPSSPKSERSNKDKNFLSFNSVMLNRLNTSRSRDDETLFTPFTTRESLTKQLAFNKHQEELFRITAQKSSQQIYQNLQNLIKHKAKRKIPKITVYTSTTFRGFGEPGNDTKKTEASTEENEEEEEESIVETQPVRWPRADLIKTWVWFWYSSPEPTQWRPGVREGSAFVFSGKQGFLYGGVSKDLHNRIEVLDPTTWQWTQPKQTGDVPEQGRQGHSIDCYEKKLVIFGGATHFNSSLHLRQCLNEVRFYKTDTHEWKYMKCIGDFVIPRRNHASAIVGRSLLIYGGLDANGNYLSDAKMLDLVKFEWKDLEIANNPGVGIAYHKACVVVASNKTKINLFKITEVRPDRGLAKIQEEGIYFFGGKIQNEEIVNTLRILKIGQKRLSWITPKTQGIPPEARYLHTMVHCAHLNILVVYGGRNDTLFSKGKSTTLDGLFVLELENLTWINVQTAGQSPVARCSHSAGVFGTKMFIFGGISFDKYCPINMDLLEMDPVESKRLKSEFEKNKIFSALPTVFVNKVKYQEDNHSKLSSSDKKPEYPGLMSYLPVVSKQDIDKRRQSKLLQKSVQNGTSINTLNAIDTTPNHSHLSKPRASRFSFMIPE